MNLNIKLLNDQAVIPKYATTGSACFDLATDGNVEYDSAGNAICGTGLAFEVPENHVMLIFSRSGHGFKYDISLSNAVGVIDSDYRDEVKIKLKAESLTGQEVLDGIKQGDRLAQAIVLPYQPAFITVVDHLSDPGTGRNGGFGSTGK